MGWLTCVGLLDAMAGSATGGATGFGSRAQGRWTVWALIVSWVTVLVTASVGGTCLRL